MKLKLNKKNTLLKYAICFGCTLSFLNTYSYAKDTNLAYQSVVKSFKGSGTEAFEGVVETSDSGLVLIGKSNSLDSGLRNFGGYDSIIIKYNKYGKEKWSHSQGGSGNDYLKGVVETSDKSLVVAGYSNSTDGGFINNGANDATVSKYDKNGNLIWIRNFGGSGNDYFYDITETQDNGVVAVGSSNSTDTEIANAGGTDAIIVKYDSEGNQVWVKSIAGLSNESLNSVAEMKNGDILVSGNSNSTNIGVSNNGNVDAILARYDSEGNQKWIINYGGSAIDYFYCATECYDEGIIAVGHSTSTNLEHTNLGGYDGIIVKYDKNGVKQWSKSLAGSSTDYLYSVSATKDKGFVVSGTSFSSNAGFTNSGSVSGIVAKYDMNGEQEWIKALTDSGNFSYFYSVIESSKGNIIAVGYSNSDFIDNKKGGYEAIAVKCGDYYTGYKDVITPVVDMNVNINKIDVVYETKKTKDGGYVVVGRSQSTNLGYTNKGKDDAIIIKYDSSWKQEWISSFGGSAYDCFMSVVELSDGSFIAVGDSKSTNAGFDCTDSDTSIIVKYDKNGKQLWVKALTSSINEVSYEAIGTPDGGVVVVGQSCFKNSEFTYTGLKATVRKFDKDGNEEWASIFGSSRDNVYESVALTKDNGFIVVGCAYGPIPNLVNAGSGDAIISKYNSNGELEWIKNFGTSSYDCYSSVATASDGGYIAVGVTDSNKDGVNDALISKYDRDGNLLWNKTIDGNKTDEFVSVTEISNGDIIAVASSSSTNLGFINGGSTDIIIVKYDKDGNQIWIKNYGGNQSDYVASVAYIDGKIFVSGYSSSTDCDFINYGDTDGIILQYDTNGNKLSTKTLELKNINNTENLEYIRGNVNRLTDEELREYLNNKIDSMYLGFDGLEIKNSSANLDIYIKSENMLMLSLDTNSVTFEDFSGIEDVVKTNIVNITINSSLPYQLNAYLPIEIQNSDKTNTMDKQILNIKENSETDYQEFTDINEKIVLKDNCPAGNDLIHGVDLKLVGGIAHEKDVYKTTIKFEAEQK